MIPLRPNNLSPVCLYLSLYISFFLFGQKALLYKSSRKHAICMCWKFWDFSSCVMQTPTGVFMKHYSSTLALHWT